MIPLVLLSSFTLSLHCCNKWEGNSSKKSKGRIEIQYPVGTDEEEEKIRRLQFMEKTGYDFGRDLLDAYFVAEQMRITKGLSTDKHGIYEALREMDSDGDRELSSEEILKCHEEVSRSHIAGTR